MGAITTGIMVAATVANGVYQSAQQRKQGRAARAQAEYEGSIYDLNAKVADAQAADAAQRGEVEAGRHQMEVDSLIGQQRAGIGAAGLDLSSGSAMAVQEEAAYLGELDRQAILNNARREALGYTTQAVNLRRQGQLVRLGGRNTQDAYNSAGTGTLITTGAQAAGTLYTKRHTLGWKGA